MGAKVELHCDECGQHRPVEYETMPEGHLVLFRPAGWTRIVDGFGDVTGEYFCSQECVDKYLARYQAERERKQA